MARRSVPMEATLYPTPLDLAAARDSGSANLSAVMAEVITERVVNSGACTEDDLARAGFTAAEIIELGPDAREIVTRQRAPRQARKAAA